MTANKKGTAVRSKRSGSFLYRVLHQRRQHQCAQGQGDDAEQGGEDHASGRELLLMAASPFGRGGIAKQ